MERRSSDLVIVVAKAEENMHIDNMGCMVEIYPLVIQQLAMEFHHRRIMEANVLFSTANC